MKTLHAELTGTDEQRNRFRDEARLTASLRHPGVVTLLDYGVAGDVPWMAFEFIEGRSLRAWVERGPTPWRDVAEMAHQVALALEEARRSGVIHRDVKPDNILECGERRFKVADFGIAKWAGSSVQTQDGMILGTPVYISPQQVQGLVPAHQSDLYALGITMFELLTGNPPFVDENPQLLLERHLTTSAPTVKGLVPDVPPVLSAIIAKLLNKSREDRYATAAELAQDLLAVLPERGPTGKETSQTGLRRPSLARRRPSIATRAIPAPAPSRRPLIAAVVGVSLVALLAIARVAKRDGGQPAVPAPTVASTASAVAAPPRSDAEAVVRRLMAEADRLRAPMEKPSDASGRNFEDFQRVLTATAGRIDAYVELLSRARTRVGPADDRLLVIQSTGATLLESVRDLSTYLTMAAFMRTTFDGQAKLKKAVHGLARALEHSAEQPEVRFASISLLPFARGLDASTPWVSREAMSKAALAAVSYLRERALREGRPDSIHSLMARVDLLDRAFYAWWALRRLDESPLSRARKDSGVAEREVRDELVRLVPSAVALDPAPAEPRDAAAMYWHLLRAALVQAEDHRASREEQVTATAGLVQLLLRRIPPYLHREDVARTALEAVPRLGAAASDLKFDIPGEELTRIQNAAQRSLDRFALEGTLDDVRRRSAELAQLGCQDTKPTPGQSASPCAERLAAVLTALATAVRFADAKALGEPAWAPVADQVISVALAASTIHPGWLDSPAAQRALAGLLPLLAVGSASPVYRRYLIRGFRPLLAAARTPDAPVRCETVRALLDAAIEVDHLLEAGSDPSGVALMLALTEAAARLATWTGEGKPLELEANAFVAERAPRLARYLAAMGEQLPERDWALCDAILQSEALALDAKAPPAARRRGLEALPPLSRLVRNDTMSEGMRTTLSGQYIQLKDYARACGVPLDCPELEAHPPQ